MRFSFLAGLYLVLVGCEQPKIGMVLGVTQDDVQERCCLDWDTVCHPAYNATSKTWHTDCHQVCDKYGSHTHRYIYTTSRKFYESKPDETWIETDRTSGGYLDQCH